MSIDHGRSPSEPGYSAEPEPKEVSAVPVSIPNASALRKVAAQIRHRLKDMELRSPVTWPASTPSAKTSGYVISEVADWQLRQWLHIIENSASAIEARRAATENTGAVHESAVGAAETANPLGSTNPNTERQSL